MGAEFGNTGNESLSEKRFSLKNKAARWAATLMVLGAGTSVAANAAKGFSEDKGLRDQATQEQLLENEQMISEKNSEYVKNNSSEDVYIIENGDGKNDVLYATGWVGEKHQYGNVENEYSLDELGQILQSITGNENVDFDQLKPGETIKILVRQKEGEK